MYKIIRFFARGGTNNKRVIKTGLTLAQAQEHCSDPETSSSTAKSAQAVRYTKKHGAWFDGYVEEPVKRYYRRKEYGRI